MSRRLDPRIRGERYDEAEDRLAEALQIKGIRKNQEKLAAARRVPTPENLALIEKRFETQIEVLDTLRKTIQSLKDQLTSVEQEAWATCRILGELSARKIDMTRELEKQETEK